MILKFIWYPIAFISFIAVVFLVYRRMKGGNTGSWIKYLVLILLLSLMAAPTMNYLLEEDLLPFQCKPITPPPAVCSSITEFSDGSTSKEILFPKWGGVNSETDIVVPIGVKVDKVEIGIRHPLKQALWVDEFFNWTKVGSYSGMSINDDEGYAFMNISRLVVDSKVVLDGFRIFDEVHIKRGGVLTTHVGKKLDLKINGALIIDSGSGINVEGKGDSNKGGGGDGTSTGVDIFGPLGSGGGGGSYGGVGGKGGDDENQIGGYGGRSYGSKTKPLSLGSPGGNGGAASGKPGSGADGASGFGGGAVKILAKEVVLNGYISADGDDGIDSAENDGTGGGGGGSGGSIYIITDKLRFNGRITANGGDGGNDRQAGKKGADGNGGGGGGGRVSMEYSSKSGSGKVSVNEGKGGGACKGENGKKGTISWVEKPASFTRLIYANITSVEISPDNLRGWGMFYANATVPGGSEVIYGIFDTSNNSILCEIKPEDALSGYNISACASGVDTIKLHTGMVTISTSVIPTLDYWKIYYDTEIKDLKMDVGLNRTGEYVNPSLSGEAVISDDNTKPRISEKITSLVKDCDCRGCSLLKDECTVNLRFSSSSSGTLILKNLDLMYCIPQ